jgi:hypothetical protein
LSSLSKSASSPQQLVVSRRQAFAAGATVLATTASLPAQARLDAVDRPDLLPKEPNLNVIQTEKFLTTGQAKRLNDLLKALERDTGFRLRVLCQSYPNTPGLGALCCCSC